ncbi:recombinase family protein [Sphingomonas sp.]|uniref:recombinase family protein n=1 Tax=Sphingomonas sp. TaxID=28214 RepID=UPI0038A5C709
MKRRCAIYTRKSTEEGLEQAFNSLDAQREACAAYILSQAHEGWERVNEHYDDGGWSGGNMARPALQQLLADVAAGRVDVIVVYKIDRLTRSLADFARIVEVLDKAGASFVSVTQSFNTTTSMGRLTLNVLLSFAQFEREVTSERIRDKVAASKRKGMWMGGPIPIGYRLESRKLLIEEPEAETVRLIFRRYLELGSVGALADELATVGIRTKVRSFANGRSVGGVFFTRGSLAQLLQNPLFVGKVSHRDELFDGEHDAIIDDGVWDQVQLLLATNRRERLHGKRTRTPSLLTGLITNEDGRPMTPVFTTKGTRQHRYYVTRLKPAEDRKPAWRIPAGDIDRAVLRCVETALTRRAAELGSPFEEPIGLDQCSVPEQRRMLLENNVRVQLKSSKIVVNIGDDVENQILIPADLARRGNELKLVLRPSDAAPEDADPVLVKLITLAVLAQQSALTSDPDPIVSRYSKRHLWQLLRVSWLAPDIIVAIIEGRQPATITGRRLLRAADIPLPWDEQRRYFGFNQASR